MRSTIALTAVALTALTAPVAAQDFRWTGRVAADQELEIRGVNGRIEATAASGDQIEVTAVKRARRSDPETVTIEVLEHAGGVTICAVYPTPRRARHDTACAPGTDGHMSTEDNDVSVHFTVKVPATVRFAGHTVNGDVAASGLVADVDVGTVNGDVDVTTRGRAEARTVNGSIDATIGRADWTGDLDFRTVNGAITLTLPADISTDVEAETVNGDIESDFPLTVSGRFGPRRLRGTIGTGGRNLDLQTVNGSIRLLRSGSR